MSNVAKLAKAEFKRLHYPSKKQLLKDALYVIAASAVTAMVTLGIDTVAHWVIGLFAA